MTKTTNKLREEIEGKLDEILMKNVFDDSDIDQILSKVKEEISKEVENMQGAVIKGTGEKWLVKDYIRREQVQEILNRIL